VSGLASYFQNRSILTVCFFALSLGVVVFQIPHESIKNQDRLFATVILSTSLSLVLSSALVSETLRGWDIHLEYALFAQVAGGHSWRPEIGDPYNSALSVTVLPLVASLVSSVDGLSIFKFVYPLLWSMAPIFLYRMYRTYVPPRAAFLACFLFMAFPTFYWEMLGLARQEIAEILLILLFWFLFFTPEVAKKRASRVLIILLCIGVIVSHYSLAYICLVVLSLYLITFYISSRTSRPILLTTITLFSVTTFVWYAATASGTPLVNLTNFAQEVVEGTLRDFFAPTSRPTIVLQALGIGSTSPGLVHVLYRAIQYTVQFLLVLGFMVLLMKRNKSQIEREAIPLSAIGLAMLGCAIILPNFAAAFNLSRFYHIALLFMSPCFAYAFDLLSWSGRLLSKLLSSLHRDYPIPPRQSKGMMLGAIVLLSYLLFTSGWVWSVTMDRPSSLILDSERMAVYPDTEVRVEYFSEITLPQDIAAAQWLGYHLGADHRVCADWVSRYHVLTSYGGLPRAGPRLPFKCDVSSSSVYMSTLNTVYGVGTDIRNGTITSWAFSTILERLATRNKAYSNGGGQIYL